MIGAVPRWDDIESLDGKIDPEIQNELMTAVDRLVESTARWYLVRAPDLRLGEAVEHDEVLLRGAVVRDRADRARGVARAA